MSLQKYNQKRNFEETAEPKAKKAGSSKGLSFVVQRHHASHLHYDFRLELDGVLKSWAIPKGPSLNPNDKRLAMMVEDHPYDYKDFEGEIPKGNYGAGTVHIFDKGNYQSLSKYRKDDITELKNGLKAGNLKFKLKGKILKGEFALVKLKNSEQNAWLLIKHNDDFAVKTKYSVEDLIPQAIKKAGKDFKKEKKKSKNTFIAPSENEISEEEMKPMLAMLSDNIFDDKDWLFERKLDGYRIVASTGKEVKLMTRNGKNYTDKYHSIANSLSKISDEAVLDGEIVAFNKTGKESFQSLQHYDNNDKEVSLKYYVFDLLSLKKNDLRELPLLKRKELLKTFLEKYNQSDIIYNEHVLEKGKSYFEIAKEEKWEGVIGKKIDDEYFSGKRSNSWLKFKFSNSQEAIICGFTQPSKSRKYFGALVLGIYENNNLKYIGNCGTGFNDEDLKLMHQKMSQLIIKNKPFADKVNQEKTVTWIKPDLICEVVYTEWTKDRHLRHPVFKGLRDDKNTKSITEEKVIDTMDNKTTSSESVKQFGRKKVKLTNLDKLYWKKEKITKGQLLDYYESVSQYILPYLKNKPLSLNRFPNGIDGPSFYQKDVDTDQIPTWAKTVDVYSESTNKKIDYLVCNDIASLLYMVNLGCIEINPWLSNYQKPENPEFMVIDLDPDNNSFQEIVSVALAVKEVYDQMNITSFIKTSGSRGLHIYVYVAEKYDYDFIKTFAEFVAQKAHELIPDITSLERTKSKRKNKIYIDYLQNRRGQTIAAPYSVRPKPNATVSFPLYWDEVNDELDMKNYHINNVLDLIHNRNDPWKDLKKQKNDLKKALKLLNQ